MADDMLELFDLDVQDVVSTELAEQEESFISFSCDGSCTRPWCI
ncbi:hypothetical protein OG500_35595 [Kitasatospora sp. NBC_01250]|nr:MULTISPECIES: hypothetical protein [unclassified Kitasatospora]WSJ71272.1 hypothetical protein OG294_37100 [Kitasatospora sp. NBC_01302]